MSKKQQLEAKLDEARKQRGKSNDSRQERFTEGLVVGFERALSYFNFWDDPEAAISENKQLIESKIPEEKEEWEGGQAGNFRGRVSAYEQAMKILTGNK